MLREPVTQSHCLDVWQQNMLQLKAKFLMIYDES